MRPGWGRQTPAGRRGFTLVEVLIAIGILALVLTAIYSTWTAILRASRSGQNAAAAVQRTRIVIRMLEDSITSAQNFVANQRYYGFVAENGDEAVLSFVARLAKSFPRSGRFGDLDVRRVTFSVEPSRDNARQLVLRQAPLMLPPDEDEVEHPIVLAKNVREFSMKFWDARMNDWVEEWPQTNQLPRLIQFTLKIADDVRPMAPVEEITRIISIPATMVPPVYQMPRLPGALPGQTNQPGPGLPTQPGVVNPGIPAQPGVIPGTPAG